MQERQISVEGISRPLPNPFLVIATQNPLENAGVYPLPEAQQDRFLIRLIIDFPTREIERQMLFSKDKELVPEVNQVTTPEEVTEIQRSIQEIKVDGKIVDYILNIIFGTRESSNIALGASPRASIALMQLGKAVAAVNGRDYVIPDDIKYIAFDVLNHRILLSHEAELDRIETRDIITGLVTKSQVVV